MPGYQVPGADLSLYNAVEHKRNISADNGPGNFGMSSFSSSLPRPLAPRPVPRTSTTTVQQTHGRNIAITPTYRSLPRPHRQQRPQQPPAPPQQPPPSEMIGEERHSR